MELLIALLNQAAENGNININIDFSERIEKIVSNICFQTLNNIHDILDDDTLSDFDCIEKIVVEMERIDFNGGSRHDFG